MGSFNSLVVFVLLFGATQMTHAQLLEKLVKKIANKDVAADTALTREEAKLKTGKRFMELMGEMEEKGQNFESTEERTFKGWSYGQGSVFLATPDGQSRYSGYMNDDGKFLALFPYEKVKPHFPVTDLIGKKCKDPDKTSISNSKAKLTMGLQYVVKDRQYLGGLVRASSMVKAKNVFNRGEEGLEGATGDYHYMYIYATKPTKVQCECHWQRDVTEEGLSAVDRLDYDLEKGWNLVKVTLVNTQQLGDKRYFTERRFETVRTELKETPWYFVYTKNY